MHLCLATLSPVPSSSLPVPLHPKSLVHSTHLLTAPLALLTYSNRHEYCHLLHFPLPSVFHFQHTDNTPPPRLPPPPHLYLSTHPSMPINLFPNLIKSFSPLGAYSPNYYREREWG
ncbi:hypothetical protein Pcinc_019660 [Petrolisthes cinctipes]|uniref:Uncharacterized protein n=1 Tax=Petrolisthes cinctipes TaxID=88211 RepID=A0AAE1FKV8_PETCI|nr:hypothetical protein Pcinc_019660 [Petrolisthes cinctipes]